MMMADNGVVTEWQSYLGNLAMVKGGGLEKYWTESEVYRCKGGNQQLAHKLVGRDRRREGADADARPLGRGRPTAACASRSPTARCSKPITSILTAPPSAWNRIAIDPVLPPALAPQMGTNVKCLIGAQRTVLAPRRARRPSC